MFYTHWQQWHSSYFFFNIICHLRLDRGQLENIFWWRGTRLNLRPPAKHVLTTKLCMITPPPHPPLAEHFLQYFTIKYCAWPRQDFIIFIEIAIGRFYRCVEVQFDIRLVWHEQVHNIFLCSRLTRCFCIFWLAMPTHNLPDDCLSFLPPCLASLLSCDAREVTPRSPVVSLQLLPLQSLVEIWSSLWLRKGRDKA